MELDFSSPPSQNNNSQPAGAPIEPPIEPVASSTSRAPILNATTPMPSVSSNIPPAIGASIPVSTDSGGNSLGQSVGQSSTSPMSQANGRMDEIMSEQVTTKNTDVSAGPATATPKTNEPKKSKLTMILLIVFLVLLLGGGAYVALATDFGKSLLGLKTADKVSITLENSQISDGVTGGTDAGSTVATGGEAGNVVTPDGTATTTGGDTAGIGNTTSAISQNDTTRKSHLVQIQTAVEAYKTQTGKYPISKTYSKATSSASEIYSLLVPDFLDSMPQDPMATDGWWYGYKSVDGENYAVTARLEDITDTQGAQDGEIFLYILTNNN